MVDTLPNGKSINWEYRKLELEEEIQLLRRQLTNKEIEYAHHLGRDHMKRGRPDECGRIILEYLETKPPNPWGHPVADICRHLTQARRADRSLFQTTNFTLQRLKNKGLINNQHRGFWTVNMTAAQRAEYARNPLRIPSKEEMDAIPEPKQGVTYRDDEPMF